MELFLFLVKSLPFIDLLGDLIAGSAPASTGGLIYDVLQAFLGLAVLARFGAWLATKTETEADDKFWAWAGNAFGRAITFLSDLATNNTRPRGG